MREQAGLYHLNYLNNCEKIVPQETQEVCRCTDNGCHVVFTYYTLGRVLREIKLTEPIRYNPGDQVEKWLNKLLCLDSTEVSPLPSGYPDPSVCQLYPLKLTCLTNYSLITKILRQQRHTLFIPQASRDLSATHGGTICLFSL